MNFRVFPASDTMHARLHSPHPRAGRILLPLFIAACLAGCGTRVQRAGTEQLILSDAVDRSVDQLDLAPLAGRKVYLDTSYMAPVKGTMFINSEYITSAIRQKMMSSGCLIQEKKDTADYVLEARVGALGADSLEVTYGIPSSNGLTQAASLLATTPAIPSIPEVSVGKRDGKIGVAKVVVFAYHRESGMPVWQSGNAVARSDAKDSWLFGVGPWTRGSVYTEQRFAGANVRLPFMRRRQPLNEDGVVEIADQYNYVHPAVLERQLADEQAAAEAAKAAQVKPAAHETAAAEAEEKK
ncbi:MAG: hypothetical protein KDA85_10745 [Planctomycetaceae bacterium]|nr:hypothetical protein [Planctomycetaceae bacterium]